MLGLTDAAIASRPVYVVSPGWAGHRRGWGAYVLERRPEVVIWYNTAGAAAPFYLGDRELAGAPRFRFFYRLRHATLPGETADGGASRVVARFLGFPFGTHPSGTLLGPDLGVRATFHQGVVAWTTMTEAPIGVYCFAFDHRGDDLWAAGDGHGRDAAALVESAAAAWRVRDGDRPPPDPAARTVVLRRCEEAYRSIEAKDFARAKAVLARAVTENETIRLPLVYRYVANVAVLTGDLFTAVDAQKEALRLAPDNALYRGNLVRLLETPWPERAPSP